MLRTHIKEALIKTYHAETRKWRKAYALAMLVSSIAIFILLLELSGFLNLFKEGDTTLSLVLTGVFSGLLVLGIVFYFFVISEKPYYQILMNEIVSHYGQRHEMQLDYQSTPRELGTIHKAQGLFGKHLSIRNRCVINGVIKEDSFATYDTRMIQSTGQSSYQVFGGFYTIIDIPNEQHTHIRSKGRPRRQHPKLVKVESTARLTLFLEESSSQSSRLDPLMKQLENILEQNELKSMYYAGYSESIHIAYEFKRRKTRFGVLSYQDLDAIYQSFHQHIKVIENIVKFFRLMK